jgi:inhibitor of cysteine peptidase
LIQPWTCDENTLEEVTLGPGENYEKDIMLYIPKKDKTEPVTFRLGFKRMSENGDVAEPLWSDPVTIKVIAPEEMKEPAPAAEAIPPAADQPLVFQDPGVPVKVRPGDEFSISLTSNPSTGYLWQMTLPEGDKTVTFLGSEHAVSQTGMVGAPGQEIFKFKAVTAGEVKADFVYRRPWETITAPPRKIFTILVQEN